jgi:hypothetical protein
LTPKRSRGPRERARLVYEIVAAYRQARRELRRAPIASVLETLRAESPPQGTAPAQATAQLDDVR